MTRRALIDRLLWFAAEAPLAELEHIIEFMRETSAGRVALAKTEPAPPDEAPDGAPTERGT